MARQGMQASWILGACAALSIGSAAHARFWQPDPIGPKDDINLYAYAKNDPVDGVDHNGRHVVWLTGDMGAAAARSQTYLMRSPSYAANYGRLVNSPQTYTIKVQSGGSHEDFNPDTRTITFDPNRGLVLRNGGVQSGALGQAHEVDHAAQEDKVGEQAFKASLGIPVSSTGFDKSGAFVVTLGTSTEEQRATTSTDNVARDLGEPLRGTYHNGVGDMRMSDPTQHVCKGSSTPTSGPC